MTASNSPWRNPWVLGWLGLLAVVIVVNGVFIYLAFATSPGLVTDEYYSAGRTLEQTILDRRAKQADHDLVINVPQGLHVKVPATFRFVGVDRNGIPVKADAVVFRAYRPSDKNDDFKGAMRKEGAGRFAIDVAFPLKGIWDIVVTLKQGKDEYNVGRRVNVAAD